jgi:hypothetical protein
LPAGDLTALGSKSGIAGAMPAYSKDNKALQFRRLNGDKFWSALERVVLQYQLYSATCFQAEPLTRLGGVTTTELTMIQNDNDKILIR